MSEILERMAAFDPTLVDRSPNGEDDPMGHQVDDDTIDLVAPDASDLVSRASAAGFQVLQAAEGLEQAGALLRVVEALARDAEVRVHEAEERAGEIDSENRELAELLELARTEHDVERERTAEAERRAEATEERLRAALERITSLEQQLAERGASPQGPHGRPQLTVIVDGERDELRSAVASEIRRPLTSILGLTLALKHADTRSSDGKAMIRRLDASARRLERLVVQMLELDQIADGTYAPNRRRADVEALVRRVVEQAPEVAELDVRLRTERIAIELDPTLTEQMVEAMLANAADRSAAGSPVWVQVTSGPGGVVIAVDDTCPETPHGLRGERGGDERASRRRTSNGLVLLTRLAELHGGKVWAEERPGGGTSVRLLLPAPGSVATTPNGNATAADGDHDPAFGPAFGDPTGYLAFGDPTGDLAFGDPVASRGRDLASFDDLSDELAI